MSSNFEISLDQLKLFFELSKWKNVNTNYEGLEAFVYPENEKLYTIIPKEEIDSDALQGYINKSVELIAYIHGQSKEETISFISDLDSDHHTYKLETKRNNISLVLLEGIVSSTKNALYKNTIYQYKEWYDKLSVTKQRKTDPPTCSQKSAENLKISTYVER